MDLPAPMDPVRPMCFGGMLKGRANRDFVESPGRISILHSQSMLAEVPAALCGATQKLKVPGSNMRSPSEVATLS